MSKFEFGRPWTVGNNPTQDSMQSLALADPTTAQVEPSYKAWQQKSKNIGTAWTPDMMIDRAKRFNQQSAEAAFRKPEKPNYDTLDRAINELKIYEGSLTRDGTLANFDTAFTMVGNKYKSLDVTDPRVQELRARWNKEKEEPDEPSGPSWMDRLKGIPVTNTEQQIEDTRNKLLNKKTPDMVQPFDFGEEEEQTDEPQPEPNMSPEDNDILAEYPD